PVHLVPPGGDAVDPMAPTCRDPNLLPTLFRDIQGGGYEPWGSGPPTLRGLGPPVPDPLAPTGPKPSDPLLTDTSVVPQDDASPPASAQSIDNATTPNDGPACVQPDATPAADPNAALVENATPPPVESTEADPGGSSLAPVDNSVDATLAPAQPADAQPQEDIPSGVAIQQEDTVSGEVQIDRPPNYSNFEPVPGGPQSIDPDQ